MKRLTSLAGALPFVKLALVMASHAAIAQTRSSAPVLSFPEAGLDDTSAYQGYRTRFYRDWAGNTIQIYLDGRSGRVVHLLANADDESIAFTARGLNGRPAKVRWDGSRAAVGGTGRRRAFEYNLVSDEPRLDIGWMLLGSMRVERDFQYAGRHKTPFTSRPFSVAEVDKLITALGRLPAAELPHHLAYLNVGSIEALRARIRPRLTVGTSGAAWRAVVIQPSLDARDTLQLEILTWPRVVDASAAGETLRLRARSGTRIPFTVRVTTTGRALTPLARAELFNAEFLSFLAAARADTTTLRARWLEREVRGVELLSSREKLMAGLPAYATYFGRDMMVSALMMRPIWRDDVSSFVVASVLRKLGPAGDVSHEEALGGQAVREAASEYASLIDQYTKASSAGNAAVADSVLARARDVLREHRRVRENYHMIDDEFHLPILASRWLADPDVSAATKRAFLLDSSDGGGTRVARLLREIALVSRMTAAYVADPVATHLVSFPQRDSTHWSSASWRDSGEGYAGGRFAMDVNAIWAPHALEGIDRILAALRALDISADSVIATDTLASASPIATYARDSLALRQAVSVWRGAWRHFVVRLDAPTVHARVAARLAVLPAAERVFWEGVLQTTRADQDSVSFMALSLDAAGQPIAVANTDPATGLFLGETESDAPRDSADRSNVLRDVRLFARPFPAGLFVDRVGPVVANDAFASPAIWPQFERDTYHGPRVVWGREVNLFLLGTANHIADAIARRESSAYVGELQRALDRVLAAVEESGFHSELWSYEIRDGVLNPVRYGSGSDLQLWSTTDLAVQFALWKLRH